MSYVERLIDLTITLGATPQNPNPTFQGTASNTVKITGLRTSVAIVKAGGRGLSTAQVRVYGLPLSVMNQLSTLGVPIVYWVGKNAITIEAGDAAAGMSTVFQGSITQAWADLDAAPEAAFNIVAFVGALDAAAPAPPTSFPGAADVATILSGLAVRAGLNFENTGVNARLASPYFPGSLMAQIQACAEAAGIGYIVDNGTLAIWPQGQARGAQVASIGPGTGLVGYPRYTGQGVSLRILYTPSIGYGSKINVDSSLTPASGTWVVYKLAYDLEAQVFGGAWFCDLEAARPGFAVISS